MRPCDIDRSGEIWEFVPESHKTEHHQQLSGGSKATRARHSLAASSCEAIPSRNDSPSCGSRSAIARNSCDLPEPDDPEMHRQSPLSTSSDSGPIIRRRRFLICSNGGALLTALYSIRESSCQSQPLHKKHPMNRNWKQAATGGVPVASRKTSRFVTAHTREPDFPR